MLEASESHVEVIEVLAPKSALVLSTGTKANDLVDERFTFNASRTIADQLVLLPSVSFNGQGGQFQSYSIRGFSRGRIRTELDGIPVITDRRAGNSVSFISPELIGSAHVIKGPSSAIYGSQALGGVVSLTTELPREARLKLSMKPQNAGISFSLRHHQDTLSSGLAYQHENNEKAANSDQLNTQYERISGFIRNEHELNGLSITWSLLPSYGQDIGKSNIKFAEQEVSEYPKELHSLAQVQISADSGWVAKIFHHYQNWDSKTLKIGQFDALSAYQSHTLGGQWLSSLPLNQGESYIGVDWLARKGVNIESRYTVFNQQDGENTSLHIQDILTNETQGNEDNLAIFNKTSWHWQDMLVSIGLRYDWISQKSLNSAQITDSKFNASFSLLMPLTANSTLEFDFANGFRYPTISERFFNGNTPRGDIQGNKELAAETSIGGQVSFSAQIAANIKAKANVFIYEMDNYIERYRINENLLSYRNIDSAQIKGVEAQLIWQFSDNIEHFIAYHNQSGEDRSGRTLDDLNPEKLSWSMVMHYQKLSIANAMNYTFNAQDVGDAETKRNSFVNWDISFDYEFSHNQTINLVINNVTNRTYFASLDEDAALQPERSIRLSTSWLF